MCAPAKGDAIWDSYLAFEQKQLDTLQAGQATRASNTETHPAVHRRCWFWVFAQQLLLIRYLPVD